MSKETWAEYCKRKRAEGNALREKKYIEVEKTFDDRMRQLYNLNTYRPLVASLWFSTSRGPLAPTMVKDLLIQLDDPRLVGHDREIYLEMALREVSRSYLQKHKQVKRLRKEVTKQRLMLEKRREELDALRTQMEKEKAGRIAHWYWMVKDDAWTLYAPRWVLRLSYDEGLWWLSMKGGRGTFSHETLEEARREAVAEADDYMGSVWDLPNAPAEKKNDQTP